MRLCCVLPLQVHTRVGSMTVVVAARERAQPVCVNAKHTLSAKVTSLNEMGEHRAVLIGAEGGLEA